MNDNQAIFVEGRGKSSSRVLSEPGGKRSIMFGGWSEEELQKQREAAERKKQIQQQPQVLEEVPSDEARCDKEEMDRSKEDETPKRSEAEEKRTEKEIACDVKEPAKEEKTEEESSNSNKSPTDDAGKANHMVSSNAFASGSNANGPNVLTGRPTSRVLAPPGGHTSIRLF